MIVCFKRKKAGDKRPAKLRSLHDVKFHWRNLTSHPRAGRLLRPTLQNTLARGNFLIELIDDAFVYDWHKT